MLVLNCNSSLPCIEEIKTIFILKNTFACLHFDLQCSLCQFCQIFRHQNLMWAQWSYSCRFNAVTISETRNDFVHASCGFHLLVKRFLQSLRSVRSACIYWYIFCKSTSYFFSFVNILFSRLCSFWIWNTVQLAWKSTALFFLFKLHFEWMKLSKGHGSMK